MTFKTNLATDAVNVLMNTDEFAEVVSYTPSGGSPVSIKALVVRERLTADGPDLGVALGRSVDVYIANDATYGRTSVTKGADKISFPVYSGGSPAVTWLVDEILSNDNGVWHVRATR